MRRNLFLILCLTAGAAWAAEPAREPTVIAKPEAFQTLVNPNCSHCVDEAKRRSTELRDDDRVLSWIRGYSDGGAIPYRFFLNSYRVISDSYGVFVYDPDAGFARGFAPSYHFRFHGWCNGVMVMKHKDGTLYSCLSGLAFAGPNKGTRLAPVPTLVSDWGASLKRYPNAVAYQMFDKYKPVELPSAVHKDSLTSRPQPDRRLAPEAAVLGVWHKGQARAYPLERVEKAGLIQEKVDNQTWVVLWDGTTRTAAAYIAQAAPPRKHSAPRPNADGVSPPDKKGDGPSRPITLKLDRKTATAPFVDVQTGSRWDIAGRAVAGELKGSTLTWLDGTQVKWFAWAAEYPESSIYQSVISMRPARRRLGLIHFIQPPPPPGVARPAGRPKDGPGFLPL